MLTIELDTDDHYVCPICGSDKHVIHQPEGALETETDEIQTFIAKDRDPDYKTTFMRVYCSGCHIVFEPSLMGGRYD